MLSRIFNFLLDAFVLSMLVLMGILLCATTCKSMPTDPLKKVEMSRFGPVIDGEFAFSECPESHRDGFITVVYDDGSANEYYCNPAGHYMLVSHLTETEKYTDERSETRREE